MGLGAVAWRANGIGESGTLEGVTVRDGAIEIGSAKAVGLIYETEEKLADRSVRFHVDFGLISKPQPENFLACGGRSVQFLKLAEKSGSKPVTGFL